MNNYIWDDPKREMASVPTWTQALLRGQKVPRAGLRELRNEQYRLRKALLDSGRTRNITVETARRATRGTAFRKSQRRFGGPPAIPLSRWERLDRYSRAQGGGLLTHRQLAQLSKTSVRENPEILQPTYRPDAKGYATPKRPKERRR